MFLHCFFPAGHSWQCVLGFSGGGVLQQGLKLFGCFSSPLLAVAL